MYADDVSFPWRETTVPGAYLTSRPAFADARGSFTKVVGEGDAPADAGFTAREVFWSGSARGTFRGLHVQLPPHATRKLVFVTHGRVRDFLLDLRRGSPTYLELHEFRLDATTGGLVVPEGCAHGFEVVSDDASMVYLQEQHHSPEHDSGIAYTSVPVVLEAEHPIVSDRDLALPDLAAFDTPFSHP